MWASVTRVPKAPSGIPIRTADRRRWRRSKQDGRQRRDQARRGCATADPSAEPRAHRAAPDVVAAKERGRSRSGIHTFGRRLPAQPGLDNASRAHHARVADRGYAVNAQRPALLPRVIPC
jgi:hypothetical protein